MPYFICYKYYVIQIIAPEIKIFGTYLRELNKKLWLSHFNRFNQIDQGS